MVILAVFLTFKVLFGNCAPPLIFSCCFSWFFLFFPIIYRNPLSLNRQPRHLGPFRLRPQLPLLCPAFSVDSPHSLLYGQGSFCIVTLGVDSPSALGLASRTFWSSQVSGALHQRLSGTGWRQSPCTTAFLTFLLRRRSWAKGPLTGCESGAFSPWLLSQLAFYGRLTKFLIVKTVLPKSSLIKSIGDHYLSLVPALVLSLPDLIRMASLI